MRYARAWFGRSGIAAVLLLLLNILLAPVAGKKGGKKDRRELRDLVEEDLDPDEREKRELREDRDRAGLSNYENPDEDDEEDDEDEEDFDDDIESYDESSKDVEEEEEEVSEVMAPSTRMTAAQRRSEKLLKRLGPRLACHNCKEAMGHFRFHVARQVKRKLSPEKKRQALDEGLARICLEKRWPKRLAIVEEHNRSWYESFEDAIARGSIRTMSPQIRKDAVSACRFFTDGHHDVLLAALLNMKVKKATDINFHKLVCLRPGKICNKKEVPDGGEEEELAQRLSRERSSRKDEEL
mmetsp:Transcript_383/g.561  ORF Transcript_383/g.561 Transcript_383/m.561 type:complete len:296 (+) Transcript_383:45-932(+)